MTPSGAQRVVFFGTPEWAVPSLEALADGSVHLALVVTNPDRPAGRGYELRPSPVKERALESGWDVLQPEKARDPHLAERLRELEPDVAVVVAYGKILPGELLAVPRCGFVNMHFSLLPAYRGAAPVQRAVMDGVRTTGVSIMVLSEGMDEGPVLATREVPVGPQETAGELGARLAEIGAVLLKEVLPDYLNGRLQAVPQDHTVATYAPKISPEEALIDWREGPRSIVDKVRGLNPAPGAWTLLRGQRLKVFGARPPDGDISALGPGELQERDGSLYVGTGGHPLELTEVQLAGRKKTGGAEMSRGLRVLPGELLGEDVAR